MDNIFAQAKNILIVWVDDVDPEKVPAFQKLIEPKAKQAEITSENVHILLECKIVLPVYKILISLFI
jgi:hypothetical protein